jgi:hypothetical protein
MGDIFIKVSLPLIEKGILDEHVMPRVHEAIGAVAETARQQWQNGVMKAPGIWSVEKKAYAQSIQWEYVNSLHARVFTTYKQADEIENGRPARDLKQMLLIAKLDRGDDQLALLFDVGLVGSVDHDVGHVRIVEIPDYPVSA